MNSAKKLSHPPPLHLDKIPQSNERQLLKIYLLKNAYHLFLELFQEKILLNHFTEHDRMDNKIFQILLHNIIETEEYTLEGIAIYTNTPFDIIYDAACGIGNQCSIILWAKLINLYLKVKPDIEKVLIDKLLALKEKNSCALFSLLTEK